MGCSCGSVGAAGATAAREADGSGGGAHRQASRPSGAGPAPNNGNGNPPGRPASSSDGTPGGAQFCGHCSQQLEGAAACPACGWRDPARIPHNCTRCKACSVRGLNFCPNCGAACWNKMQRTAPAVTPLSDDVLALADNPWPRGVEEGSTVCIGCSTRVDLRFCPGCGKEDRTENQTLRLKKSWTNALPSSWADSSALPQGSAQQRLDQILASKPYLESPEHFLNYYVRLCARATADEDEEGAQHAWDNLSMAVDNEERTVAVAFRMFDKDRSSKLDLEELQFMLQYIGLPSSLEDAEALLRRTDTNNDMSISFEEFLLYVGEMGGCRNLVQGRREQIESRLPFKRRRRRSQENRLLVNSQDPAQAQVVSPEEHSPVRNKSSRLKSSGSWESGRSARPPNDAAGTASPKLSDGVTSPCASEALGSLPVSLASSRSLASSAPAARSLASSLASSDSLRSCGFKDQESAAWRLVVAPAELEAVAQLQPCQQLAIRHIRALAQENHERALPYLQRRALGLGFSDGDLQMALLWVRDLADIICHVKLEKVGPAILHDTHYRNQFETNTSSGFLKHEARIRWERVLFGPAYDGVEGLDRPKYGVQNILNDYRGVLGCKQYGDSYIVLQGVRLRCTCSAQDSALLPARRLAVLDFYASALQEYSDKELTALLQVAKGGGELVGDSLAVVERWGRYKEVQIHGEIRWDTNVSALVVNDRHRGDPLVEKIRQKLPAPVRWMEDMKSRVVNRADRLQTRDSSVKLNSLYEDSQSSTTSI